MLDFPPAPGSVGVHQKPDAFGERSRDGDLGGMQQSDDVPAKFLGGARRESRIEVTGHGKQGTHDVIGLELVGFNQRPQQFVRGRKDLIRIVAVDCRGSPNAMQAN